MLFDENTDTGINDFEQRCEKIVPFSTDVQATSLFNVSDDVNGIFMLTELKC